MRCKIILFCCKILTQDYNSFPGKNTEKIIKKTINLRKKLFHFVSKKTNLTFLVISLSNYAPMKRCTLNFDGLSTLFVNFWLSNSEFDSFTKKFCKESKSKILKTLNRARLVFWHISTLRSQDLDF